MYTFYSGIDCVAVHINDPLALSAVSFLDRILYMLNSIFDRKNIDQLEESSLQNSIGASTQTQTSCNRYCIASVELDIILRRKVPPDFTSSTILYLWR